MTIATLHEEVRLNAQLRVAVIVVALTIAGTVVFAWITRQVGDVATALFVTVVGLVILGQLHGIRELRRRLREGLREARGEVDSLMVLEGASNADGNASDAS